MENPYSRILAVEVWNFMSIEHGRVEFDDTNIINLKGYNDSGKSSILTALKVALLNSNPTKQASFIQDDKDYFRVVVYFDDGVQLLRDKYLNGQSLIEMYRDGECIFTTKSGRTLTRITDVPQPVADYLGLVTFDGGALNARSCFEKQLGVQTSGSENYKMFNTVLKSEEIATAATLLNNDKNKLATDISAVDAEIQAQKQLLGDGDKLKMSMVDWLKEHDRELDAAEVAETAIQQAQGLVNAIESVQLYPEVPTVDMSQLSTLQAISGVVNALAEVRVAPEVEIVDVSQLTALMNLIGVRDALVGARVSPEVSSVDTSQVEALIGLQTLVRGISDAYSEVASLDAQLADADVELQNLQAEAARHGSKFVKCPNCGELFDPEVGHADE